MQPDSEEIPHTLPTPNTWPRTLSRQVAPDRATPRIENPATKNLD